MGSHRVGDTGLSNSGPSNIHHYHQHHHIPYAVPHGLPPLSTNFMNHQEGSAFDFGELEEAIVLQNLKLNHDDSKLSFYTAKPAATLEMFPSWPMKLQQTPGGSSRSGGESTDSGSAVNTLSSKAGGHLEPESPVSTKLSSDHQQAFDHNHLQFPQENHHHHQQQLQVVEMASDSPRSSSGPSQTHPSSNTILEKRRGPGATSDRVLDPKTLRRLAQNREAARKSRLRKKAYVQQLESSRIRLSQLEQDLQRARSQGLFMGGGSGGNAGGSMSPGAALFDMEYARWLDDDQRHMAELRTGLQAHLSDGDLRVIVDGHIAHYDEIFRLKGVAAKSDVFHLITGLWTTPAERCFLWMGGFRPSELIKTLIAQMDPLTEQQLVGIYSLQHSSQQAEEALSQGLEQLQQSLIDTVASGSINDGMHHMAVALGKLTNLEGFVRQIQVLKELEGKLSVSNQRTPTESTVLHLASQYGSIKCVEEILNVYESLLLKLDLRGETALHLAAREGHYVVVEALVVKAKSSLLPLDYLQNTSSTAVQILIRLANVEFETALHAAVRYNHNDVVQLLITQDPKHSHPQNMYNETPLYLASNRCYTHIVKTILDNCESPTFGGPDGRTALHAAVLDECGCGCARLLLQKKKDLLKIVDDHGWTAFHYVAFNDLYTVVKDLISADKSVAYLADKEFKRTALHVAADQGNVRVMKELVKYIPDSLDVLDAKVKDPDCEKPDIEQGITYLRHTEEIAQKEIERYDKFMSTHMIVAALIATVALTAGFAMPGGFDGNEGPTQGSAILLRKTAFQTFMVTDAIALLCSISSLFLYFNTPFYRDTSTLGTLVISSSVLSLFSLIAMMLAFITGTYAVLVHSTALAISVCVISCFFFPLVIFVFCRLPFV